jgi:hypothetical protein
VVLLILEYFTQKVNIFSQYFTQFKKGGDHLLYNNVKALCEEHGISISFLERELDFPRSSICKWNENEPGIRKVQKVADYLNIPIEKLLEDKEGT